MLTGIVIILLFVSRKITNDILLGELSTSVRNVDFLLSTRLSKTLRVNC